MMKSKPRMRMTAQMGGDTDNKTHQESGGEMTTNAGSHGKVARMHTPRDTATMGDNTDGRKLAAGKNGGAKKKGKLTFTTELASDYEDIWDGMVITDDGDQDASFDKDLGSDLEDKWEDWVSNWRMNWDCYQWSSAMRDTYPWEGSKITQHSTVPGTHPR